MKEKIPPMRRVILMYASDSGTIKEDLNIQCSSTDTYVTECVAVLLLYIEQLNMLLYCCWNSEDTLPERLCWWFFSARLQKLSNVLLTNSNTGVSGRALMFKLLWSFPLSEAYIVHQYNSAHWWYFFLYYNSAVMLT